MPAPFSSLRASRRDVEPFRGGASRRPAGEIDIIARRRHIVAFIEVKTRDELGAAGEAIGARQRERIRRAASLYLARHPALASLDARFDAVLIRPWRWPVHIRDAWRD